MIGHEAVRPKMGSDPVFRALFFALVTVIAVQLCGCSSTEGDEAAALRMWNDRLSSELRPGASKQDVEQFFMRYGLDHGFRELDRTHWATDENVAVDSLVSTRIQLECKLDPSDVLVACTATPQYTGP